MKRTRVKRPVLEQFEYLLDEFAPFVAAQLGSEDVRLIGGGADRVYWRERFFEAVMGSKAPDQ